jgi:hypothetical protein
VVTKGNTMLTNDTQRKNAARVQRYAKEAIRRLQELVKDLGEVEPHETFVWDEFRADVEAAQLQLQFAWDTCKACE